MAAIATEAAVSGKAQDTLNIFLPCPCDFPPSKKAIIRTQRYQILESKIALQHKKQAISFYWLTQFNQIPLLFVKISTYI